jgi:peptide deformylase
MAVLQVLSYPNPILKRLTVEVDLKDPSLARFARDLVDTMRASKGCVGLAAPQVGRSIQVIAVEAKRYRKDPGKHHGCIVLVNPRITRYEGEQLIREGCLSVPDYTGNVRRALRIHVEGFDEKGRQVRIEAQDFEAIVFQHELDHLKGVLFLDRLRSIKTDLFSRKNYLN